MGFGTLGNKRKNISSTFFSRSSSDRTAFGLVGDQMAPARLTRRPSAHRRLSGADEAKKLTARMKEVNSAVGLIDILDGVVETWQGSVDGVSMFYHILCFLFSGFVEVDWCKEASSRTVNWMLCVTCLD